MDEGELNSFAENVVVYLFCSLISGNASNMRGYKFQRTIQHQLALVAYIEHSVERSKHIKSKCKGNNLVRMNISLIPKQYTNAYNKRNMIQYPNTVHRQTYEKCARTFPFSTAAAVFFFLFCFFLFIRFESVSMGRQFIENIKHMSHVLSELVVKYLICAGFG